MEIYKRIIFLTTTFAMSGCLYSQTLTPNIVYILADDIGYGDFGCYGAKRIKTPNIDQLAKEGVLFTQAYAPASTSSPSRYALLTGEYAFRKKVFILPGNAPLTIDTTCLTLPKLLKNVGYRTALVGKWHLGLGDKGNMIDFNGEITPGPLEIGFDYAYYFPATNDRVPCVYIENHKVDKWDEKDPIKVSYQQKVGTEPTGKENPELLKLNHFIDHDGTIVNGIGRIGWMKGGHAARWTDETMGDVLLSKAKDFIKTNNKKSPFFLCYFTHNAHEPRVPSALFRGHSKAGVYGDVIEEFDYYVGEIVKTLKQEGLYENTLIVVTSDNGPQIKQGYEDGSLEHLNGHNPYRGLRGRKGQRYEGGLRVPFIASCPVFHINPFVQHQPFCYIDMLATLASLTQQHVPDADLKDSQNALQLFKDKNAPVYRDYLLLEGDGLTVRQGDWKYIPANKLGFKDELFNMTDVNPECDNQADKYPEIKNHLQQICNQFKFR